MCVDVTATERGIKERGVSQTTSELQAVPIPRREVEEGWGSAKRRVVDGADLDESEEAHLVARVFVKESPANVNLERLDFL